MQKISTEEPFATLPGKAQSDKHMQAPWTTSSANSPKKLVTYRKHRSNIHYTSRLF